MIFLELWSEGGGLLAAMRNRHNLACLGLDPRDGAHLDLSRRSTQRCVLDWIRTGRVWGIHLRPPCRWWSCARRGATTSCVKNVSCERSAVAIAMFVAEVVRLSQRCEVLWSISNPASSSFWGFGPIGTLAGLNGAEWVEFPMCAYGCPYKKPMRVLTNATVLRELESVCTHRSHRVRLCGRTKSCSSHLPLWTNRTELARDFSRELCSAWASAISKQAPDCAHGKPSAWIVEWLDELYEAQSYKWASSCRSTLDRPPGLEHLDTETRLQNLGTSRSWHLTGGGTKKAC